FADAPGSFVPPPASLRHAGSAGTDLAPPVDRALQKAVSMQVLRERASVACPGRCARTAFAMTLVESTPIPAETDGPSRAKKQARDAARVVAFGFGAARALAEPTDGAPLYPWAW